MGGQDTKVDREVERIASSAKGVVTHDELTGAGLSARQVERRLGRRSLIRVHRGVYRVGHAAEWLEATYMAAVKACGTRAWLSGRAAAFHFGVLRGAPPPAEVTTRSERRIEGIRSRTRRLDPRDCATWRGIPVTTLARTIVDLAGLLTERELARAFHEASVQHALTPDRVEVVLRRNTKAKGAARLRRVLHGDSPLLLSKLERGFIATLRKHRLPLPETNRPAGGRFVDCRWPERKLTVELDGYRYHSSRHAWEQDRRREREAYGRGDQFRRYTWADVFEDQEPMLRELRALLY